MTAAPPDAPARHRNALGQPVGAPLPDWRAAAWPPRVPLAGRFCRVEPLDPERHAADLFAAFAADAEGRMWTYLPYGPFATRAAFDAWLRERAAGGDPLFHAIVPADGGRAAGLASYLRIQPDVGVIEIGHIALAPGLQRTPAATEAMTLLLGRAFDGLGYRRCEWKCDALNAASRRAAERLGFTFEGVFRQANISKGRNRDTAWYAILDGEWPALRQAHAAWLDAGNFDADGGQRTPLAALIAKARAASADGSVSGRPPR